MFNLMTELNKIAENKAHTFSCTT